MFDMDIVSKRLNKSLDLIFLRHPIRTAFGFLIGFIIYACVYTLRKIISANWFDVDAIHYTSCFIIGILIMHIHTVIDAYNGTALDERLANLLKTIENRTDLSKEQKRLMVTNILSKEIESMTPQELNGVENKITEK